MFRFQSRTQFDKNIGRGMIRMNQVVKACSAAALLVTALAELAWKKLAPRWAPKIHARHPRLIE